SPPILRAPVATATCGSRTGAVLRPTRAAALVAGRPPAVADTDTSPDESGSARRRVVGGGRTGEAARGQAAEGSGGDRKRFGNDGRPWRAAGGAEADRGVGTQSWAARIGTGFFRRSLAAHKSGREAIGTLIAERA